MDQSLTDQFETHLQPVGCKGGRRYVEGCCGFPYLKKFIGFKNNFEDRNKETCDIKHICSTNICSRKQFPNHISKQCSNTCSTRFQTTGVSHFPSFWKLCNKLVGSIFADCSAGLIWSSFGCLNCVEFPDRLDWGDLLVSVELGPSPRRNW